MSAGLDLIQVLQEFLEVAIHYILYIRSVYPQDLFDQYKKYNVPVWKSRHPKLAAYVASVVRACITEIKQGNVQRLVVAIKDEATQEQLEHFVFGLTWLKPSHWFADAEIRRQYDSGLNLQDIELKLRAFLLKMSTLDAQLGPIPEDITFSVFLELSEDGEPPLQPDPATGESAPWLPATMPEADAVAAPIASPPGGGAADMDDEARLFAPSASSTEPNARLHALKRTKLGMIDLEMEVEESPAKQAYLQRKMQREELQKRHTVDVKGKGRAF